MHVSVLEWKWYALDSNGIRHSCVCEVKCKQCLWCLASGFIGSETKPNEIRLNMLWDKWIHNANFCVWSFRLIWISKETFLENYLFCHITEFNLILFYIFGWMAEQKKMGNAKSSAFSIALRNQELPFITSFLCYQGWWEIKLNLDHEEYSALLFWSLKLARRKKLY